MRITYTIQGPATADQKAYIRSIVKRVSKHDNIYAVIPKDSKHADRVTKAGGKLKIVDEPEHVRDGIGKYPPITFAVVTKEDIFKAKYKGSHVAVVCLERSSWETDIKSVLGFLYGLGHLAEEP